MAWFAKMRVLIFVAAAGMLAQMVGGCASEPGSGSYHDPNTYATALYGEAAAQAFAYEGPRRNPVVVIHGLLGARLSDFSTGENVWGNFSYSTMAQGGNFSRLAHPMRLHVPLGQLTNSVSSSGVLEKSAVQVLGLEILLDNYDILLDMLEKTGYQADNQPLPADKSFYSLFVFHYDWRRDISENAVALEAFLESKKKYLQTRYETLYSVKDYPVKFDLIGHSMGGLLARYYAMYGGIPLPEEENKILPVTWSGARDIDKIIMIGTPNAGYVDTLFELNKGLRLVAASPTYPKALIGTFVSYYQMLPDVSSRAVVYSDNDEAVDYFSEQVWEHYQWGVLDPAQDLWLQKILPGVATPEERRATALDHLKKSLTRARQFKKALTPADGTAQPQSLKFYLIAGDAVLTNRTLEVDRENGSLSVRKRETGDGKVTSSSALFDRRSGPDWQWYINSPIRWDGVFFLQGGHMGIMNGETFASNIRFLLTSLPPGRTVK